MSVVAISPDLVEINTLLLQPSQSYTTSSAGEFGCIKLFSKPTDAVKVIPNRGQGLTFTEEAKITSDDDFLYDASQQYRAGSTNIFQQISAYITSVNSTQTDQRNSIEVCPKRYDSPSQFLTPEVDLQTGRIALQVDPFDWQNLQRRVIRECLIPQALVENSLSFYGYVNYNSINFVSCSNFPTASAIIFPNFPDAYGIRDYTPERDFTLDFFIKPLAQFDNAKEYRAGTILHISSSICVSLVSGSSLGPDAKPDKFRIMLQLSQSADTKPSSIALSSLPLSFPNNLVFITPEVLDRDAWSRVTVRWGGAQRSRGEGSIQVNQSLTQFSANFPSISTGLASDAMMIGNYYDSGDRIAKFFNTVSAAKYGTLIDPVPGSSVDPTGFTLSHPLHAEIHHISMFKRFLDSSQIGNINDYYQLGPADGGPAFFMAPYFTSSIPANIILPITPTDTDEGKTDSPISYKMALGYNALYVNNQNFFIDFARNKQSRALGMSEYSEITDNFDLRNGTVDDLIMKQESVRKRNFSIMPCDDGNFSPDFSFVDNDITRFHIVDNLTSSMLISLERLAPDNTYIPIAEFGSFNYDGSDGQYLPFLQDMNFGTARSSLADLSSNRVIIFSIPSIFYLNRIVPSTFVLTDSNLSGSGGLSVTLRDDGRGNLYRSNCTTSQATWNRCGTILYSHGLVAILTPHLPFFGKNGYEMSFRGETRKIVANYLIPAPPETVNASFNPTYKEFPPTDLLSEQAENFTYITGINLHDENLNVIMRGKVSQTVQKREGDELVFRLRYDF